MTLLSLCQAVSNRIGLDNVPVTIIGNPDPDAQRLLVFANQVGSDLASRAPWQANQRIASFVAAATQDQPGAIPADFGRFSPETMWDTSSQRSITGPVTPAEYQSRVQNTFYQGDLGPIRWFTRRGNDLLIWPIMGGGETITFEYQSNAFCQSAGGTPQTQWLADDDTAVMPEELFILGVTAQFLLADGQPVQAQMATFERRVSTEIRNDLPNARVLQAGDVFGSRRRFTGEPGAGNTYWGWNW